MVTLFEKLIDSGAWTMLSTPTEKLLIAWFATKYPNKTLEELLTEFPARIIIAGIGSQHKYVSRSLTTISANAEFVQAYSKLHSKSRHKTVK